MLSGNIVSLTPMRKPIIQKLEKWPGQNDELHGSQQTTIKEGNTVMSRQPLQPRNNFQPPPKSQNPSQGTRRRKRSIPIPKHPLLKLHKHLINPIPCQVSSRDNPPPSHIKSSLVFSVY
jgi:hypothetical protein